MANGQWPSCNDQNKNYYSGVLEIVLDPEDLWRKYGTAVLLNNPTQLQYND